MLNRKTFVSVVTAAVSTTCVIKESLASSPTTTTAFLPAHHHGHGHGQHGHAQLSPSGVIITKSSSSSPLPIPLPYCPPSPSSSQRRERLSSTLLDSSVADQPITSETKNKDSDSDIDEMDMETFLDDLEDQRRELRTTIEENHVEHNIDLNGEVIGGGDDGRQYLLAGEPKQTTSGRSFLWTAYRRGGSSSGSNDGVAQAAAPVPVGKALAVKISSDIEAMEHEHANYDLLEEKDAHQLFVSQLDFFPVYGDTIEIQGEFIPINKKMALVMERGEEDLESYLMRDKAQGMTGKSLQRTAMTAVQCLQDLHNAGLVWTDLKSQNFVVFPNDADGTGTAEDIMTIKGIDLESAVPVHGHPIDYCPEACPPEMARAIAFRHEASFVLEYSYDIWSLGMFLYELSSGRGHYYDKPRGYILRMLGGALPGYKPKVAATIDDKVLANLIALCLQDDPRKRPSVAEILDHPYFLD